MYADGCHDDSQSGMKEDFRRKGRRAADRKQQERKEQPTTLSHGTEEMLKGFSGGSWKAVGAENVKMTQRVKEDPCAKKRECSSMVLFITFECTDLLCCRTLLPVWARPQGSRLVRTLVHWSIGKTKQLPHHPIAVQSNRSKSQHHCLH